jgi:hypothetical protein
VSGGKQEASDASFEDDRKDIIERARKARHHHLRFAAYRTQSTLQGFGCVEKQKFPSSRRRAL